MRIDDGVAAVMQALTQCLTVLRWLGCVLGRRDQPLRMNTERRWPSIAQVKSRSGFELSSSSRSRAARSTLRPTILTSLPPLSLPLNPPFCFSDHAFRAGVGECGPWLAAAPLLARPQVVTSGPRALAKPPGFLIRPDIARRARFSQAGPSWIVAAVVS